MTSTHFIQLIAAPKGPEAIGSHYDSTQRFVVAAVRSAVRFGNVKPHPKGEVQCSTLRGYGRWATRVRREALGNFDQGSWLWILGLHCAYLCRVSHSRVYKWHCPPPGPHLQQVAEYRYGALNGRLESEILIIFQALSKNVISLFSSRPDGLVV